MASAGRPVTRLLLSSTITTEGHKPIDTRDPLPGFYLQNTCKLALQAAAWTYEEVSRRLGVEKPALREANCMQLLHRVSVHMGQGWCTCGRASI
jgi:hypothetical protein